MTSDLSQDVRQAARILLRQPGFAAAAVVMLALGIGATTAIFTVVNSVLIRPLPYPDADELVRIAHNIGGIDQAYFSDEIFLTYQKNTQAFQDLGVWIPAGRANITGQGEPEEVRALAVSRGLLTTLGMRPEVGRWFSPEDETPAADAVMIGHPYWQRRFGGDRSVVGRVIIVDSRPYHIIGVMPAEFRFRGEHDVIRLLRINPGRPTPGFRLNGVARLKPEITLGQANADVTRMFPIWMKDPALRARWAPALRPLKQDIVGDIGNTLWVLMGTIAMVLLMACANVANLLLVRADGRRQELAIRAALGAGWTRLARAMLIESVALAALGGLLGLAVAYAGVRALVAMGPANLPRLLEITIDPLALGFALVVSLLSGLLFGMIPILKYVRPELAATLASAGRSFTLTRERRRSNNALVAAQMAFALILLVSAGLMIRSFQALRNVEPGFTRPHEVQTFAISMPATEVAEPERVARLQHEIVDKIAAIPGVSATAFTTRLPMDETNRSSAAMTAENRPENRATPPNRHVRFVSPGMFQTLETPLVAGRDFTWTDIYERREVAIVSENLAREFWGSPAAALGRRVREFYDGSSPWREIVGVAGNVHDDGVHQAPPATVYWPAQWTSRTFGAVGYQPRRVAVAVRSERAGTEGLLHEIGEAVQSVHTNLPLAQVRTLGEVYDQSMARTSFTLVMLTIAGTMALLLGVFGLYGVLSYTVTRRRREIGIRLALGAQSREILALFVRRGLIVTGAGVALGLAGAAGFSQVMRALLFGVSPLDPVTFAGVPVLIAMVALIASYLPARRALSVDPIETIRVE